MISNTEKQIYNVEQITENLQKRRRKRREKINKPVNSNPYSYGNLLTLKRTFTSHEDRLRSLIGKEIFIKRCRSRSGLDSIQITATGIIRQVTDRVVFIERTDLFSEPNSSHPQYTSFTFADFLTDLYSWSDDLNTIDAHKANPRQFRKELFKDDPKSA